jgi:transposase InsO family protein
MTSLHNQGHSLKSICNHVGISRQAYYKRCSQSDHQISVFLKAEEAVVRNRAKKSRAGLRTIYYKEQLSSLLGLNTYEQEMSARGYALKPYRSYIKTTDSRGHFNKFSNLVSGMEIRSENELIVGDITYYQSKGDLYYIYQFQDYYTLEIKGLIGGKTLEGIHAEKCLRQVFSYNSRKKYGNKLIVHTDAGSQYRSDKFQKMLRTAQARPSHAQNCFENGLAERTNGILKNEYLVDYDIKSVDHLNRVLRKIKQEVNQDWPSQKLGYLTPRAYAQKLRSMKRIDRPVKIVKEVEKL